MIGKTLVEVCLLLHCLNWFIQTVLYGFFMAEMPLFAPIFCNKRIVVWKSTLFGPVKSDEVSPWCSTYPFHRYSFERKIRYIQNRRSKLFDLSVWTFFFAKLYFQCFVIWCTPISPHLSLDCKEIQLRY